ncbi:MAG: NADPH-dependent F420 reductase [Corynebacterium casei]
MTNVTIFGSGNMDTAIADIFQAGGADVQFIGSDGQGAVEGDVVVLAVPYPALAQIVASHGDQLDGKVVIDITNPLDFNTFDSLTVPAGSSAAAELAEKLPKASVVKAFNTNFAATLATKKVGELATTVLIAGDDEAAKNTLASAITAAGVEAIDAGSLKRAHELEAIGFLQLTLAASEKIGWTGGFGIVR